MSCLNRRILVVDDNRAIQADFRKILCRPRCDFEPDSADFLDEPGISQPDPLFDLDFACQGDEAVKRIAVSCGQKRPYAMAFIDMRMPPGLDGIETISKAWEVDPDLQIVICTAYSDYSWEQLTDKLKQPDRFVILKKPFDMVEVLQLANAFTTKRQLIDQVQEHTRSLQESEKRFRCLADSVPGIVWTADADGKMDYANQRLCEYSGSPFELNRGSGWESLVHPDDLPTCLSEWRKALQVQQPYHAEYRLRRASDRAYRWFLTRALPMRDESGQLRRWVGTSIDIDDQKTQEAALRQVSLELERRVAERTEDLRAKTALFQAQVNSSPDGILVVSSEGKKVLQNERSKALWKLPPEISETKDDERQERFVASLTKNPEEFAAKVAYLYSHPDAVSRDEIELKDGTVLERYSSPVTGEDGKHHGRVWLFHDITKRKRVEEVLRSQQESFRALTDNVPDAIARIDRQLRFVYVNRVLADGLGMTSAEMLGKTNAELGLSAQEQWNNAARQVFETGQTVTLEFEDKRREILRYLEARLAPELAPSGEVQYVLAVTRDITERKAAEKEHQIMELQLRQAHKLESIGQLAAGIAHEINTPTQYVGDNTRFLKDSFESISKVLKAYEGLLGAGRKGALTPELLDSVDETLKACDLAYLFEQIPAAINETLEGVERVTKIVRAMKEFSHPGGKEKCAADLNKAIETTVTVARNEWKYVADLELDLDPALPPVPCLLGEFNQCILNLVINAAHAIGDVVHQRPGTKGKIIVQTRREGDNVAIRVSDTGTGIPEAIRSKIFDPFFTTKQVGKGTGQGLSILYGSIVTKHGGTVTFETEVGKGTTFIVRLPIQRSLDGGGSGPVPGASRDAKVLQLQPQGSD